MTERGVATAFTVPRPSCLISTHLDDAALSCSHWLAARPGVDVVTVFTGAPDVEWRDGWNYRSTGESSARKASAIRRDEDRAAMAALGVTPIWLDVTDPQYERGATDRRAVRAAIGRALGVIRPASVVAPLGLHHPDHRVVGDACLELARSSTVEWYCYLDMPYAQTFPDEVPDRIAEVSGNGNVELVDQPAVEPATAIKEGVVRLYRSQWEPVRHTLTGFERSLSAPERYWRIVVRKRRSRMEDIAESIEHTGRTLKRLRRRAVTGASGR
jgi:LmbE family N-acetylglucosaminyl deacetylase